MERTSREAPLALPLALMGLAGGWLTAHVTVGNNSGDGPIALLLMVFTPILSAFLGEHLRKRVRHAFVVRTVLATMIAGVLNGVVIGLFLGLGPGMLVGAIAGFFFSLPFVPALLLVVGFGRRVGRAGLGSIVDSADRRGPWAATFVTIALGALLALPDHGGTAPLLLTWLAVFGLVALCMLDLEAIGRLRHVAAMTQGMHRRERLEPHMVAVDAEAVDVGIGDESWDEVVKAASPYRETDRLVRVVHGSPAQARAALIAAIRRDVIAFVVVLAALSMQMSFVRVID
jgi:hypothetical protein